MPNKGSEMLLLHNQHGGGGASEGATHITTGGRHNFTEHKQTHTHTDAAYLQTYFRLSRLSASLLTQY